MKQITKISTERHHVAIRFLGLLIILTLFCVLLGLGYVLLWDHDKLGSQNQDQVPLLLQENRTLNFVSKTPGPQNLIQETHEPQNLTSNPIFDPEKLQEKRNLIKQMTVEAWSHINQSFWHYNHGLTASKSLSTLYLMNLKKEYLQGRNWIEKEFNFHKIQDGMYVFHAVTQFIGSFLSCYALTGDQMFLRKAIEVGEALKPAHRLAGLPYDHIFPHTNKTDGQFHGLAPVGALELEYRYLSYLTNDSSYLDSIRNIRKVLKDLDKPQGLYMRKLSNSSWMSATSSLFWPSNAFYAGLIKSFVQSKDVETLELYEQALESIRSVGMLNKTVNSNLWVARDYDTNRKSLGKFMKVDGCGLGAMLSLDQNSTHLAWAEGIAKTCHFVAKTRTKTGLIPWKIYINDSTGEITNMNVACVNSELPESYFHLYRRTGDPKYREYAWEYAQAIYNYSRVHNQTTNEVSYLHLINVDQDYQFANMNRLPAHFISSTLKYLYLIFSDQIQLDQWVFNAFGQPLPICGQNAAYEKC